LALALRLLALAFRLLALALNLPALLTSLVLRLLDLVPLTDFTYKYRPAEGVRYNASERA